MAGAHKILSVAAAVAVVWGGYWTYGKLTSTAGETRYVLGKAQKGTLIVSVSASGQVTAVNQIDVKPKVSGDVIAVGVRAGDAVPQGKLIAQLDARDAERAVRDAKASLENAQLSFQKLTQPADALSVIQAENGLAQAQDSLKKSYDDGFNDIAGAFLDLPGVMSGLDDILYGKTVNHSAQDNISAYGDMVRTDDTRVDAFQKDAAAKYATARAAYDGAFDAYKTVSRFSDSGTIAAVIDTTYEATRKVAESVKSARDLLNFVKDRLTDLSRSVPAILGLHQASLGTYTTETNTHVQNLFGAKNTIVSTERTLTEKTEQLAKLKRGADELDIASSKLTVTQRQNALRDAELTLNDYYIRAPFAGTIAKLNVKTYDTAGPGTVIATLTSSERFAEISLNEIDAAHIAVGQKATLTFDAVEGLSLTGEVAEVDTVGTLSQGVVTYGVKVRFDTQDDRVKPGMSVDAAIITDSKVDVLMVPNSAVKSRGDAHYVQMLDVPGAAIGGQGVPSTIAPREQSVTTGLANDTNTEIASGLKEGDVVVVSVIAGSAAATPAPSSSAIRIPGLGGGNRAAGGGR